MRVFIYFIHLDGELFFEYSFCEDSSLTEDFINQFPDCESLEVMTENEEFSQDDVWDCLIENGEYKLSMV